MLIFPIFIGIFKIYKNYEYFFIQSNKITLNRDRFFSVSWFRECWSWTDLAAEERKGKLFDAGGKLRAPAFRRERKMRKLREWRKTFSRGVHNSRNRTMIQRSFSFRVMESNSQKRTSNLICKAIASDNWRGELFLYSGCLFSLIWIYSRAKTPKAPEQTGNTRQRPDSLR